MAALIVDVIVVAVVLGFAAYGFRDGFVAALSALVGLTLGLVASIPLATFIGTKVDDAAWRTVATIGIIAVVGNIGFVVGGVLGTRLRRTLKLRVAKGVDQGLGALLTAAVAAVLCWMLALPLATSQIPAVAAQVKQSVLLPAIDRVLPDGARGIYGAISQTLREQGLPDVLGPLDSTQSVEVAPPDPSVAGNAAVVAAGESVVKVLASSSRCGRAAAGSAFVVSDQHVITNAHVIAGATEIELATRQGSVPAAVVYTDEQTDVAVLYAPDLQLDPLPLRSTPLGAGDDVVVAGYPGGGAFTLGAGRVASVGMVTGPNFRQDGTVNREVYALRATIIPGNSGGPMLDSAGNVAGVVFASAADNSEVGYALTLDAVSGALEHAGATEPVGSGSCYG